MVAATGGHLDRSLGGLLALDVLEIEGFRPDLGERRLGRPAPLKTVPARGACS